MSSDHDRCGIGLNLPNKFQNFHPRSGGFHHKIRDDNVEISVAKFLFCSLFAVDNGANMTRLVERFGHSFRMILFVIDDQHLRADEILSICHR